MTNKSWFALAFGLLVFVVMGFTSGTGYKTIQDESSDLNQRQTLNFTGAGVTCADDSGNARTNCTIDGGYSTIQEEGSDLTQRATLDFIGSSITCADDSGNSRTNCTIASYNTVQDEGSGLTQRPTINFIGSSVDCVDNSGSSRTDCTISAAATAPGGSPTNLQYNNSGSFGGITGSGWDGANLTLPNVNSTGAIAGSSTIKVGPTLSATYADSFYYNSNDANLLTIVNSNTGASAKSVVSLGNSGTENAAQFWVNSTGNSSFGGASSAGIGTVNNTPFVFIQNNSEVGRFVTGGGLSINNASPEQGAHAYQVIVSGASSSSLQPAYYVDTYSGNAGSYGALYFYRSLNNSINGRTALISGTPIGRIAVFGVDSGGNYASGGYAQFQVDSSPGSSIMPTSYVIYTGKTSAGTAIGFQVDSSQRTFVNLLQVGATIGTSATDNQFSTGSLGSGSTTMYIGNSSIDVTVSDARLKDVLGPSQQNATAIVNALPLVDYYWRPGTSLAARPTNGPWLGLTAQQLYGLLPQYVMKPDNPESNWSINYQYMVPLAFKALQEQDARITQLEKIVEELRAK